MFLDCLKGGEQKADGLIRLQVAAPAPPPHNQRKLSFLIPWNVVQPKDAPWSPKSMKDSTIIQDKNKTLNKGLSRN